MVLFQQSRSDILNDTINKSATSVFLNSSSNCGQNNNSIQQLSFSDIKTGKGCNTIFDGITQMSVQSPIFSCTSNTANETDLLSKFKTELQQNSKSLVSGLSGALSSDSISTATNKLVNDVSKNISINSLSNCVQDNYSKQILDFKNIELSCPAYCGNPDLCSGLSLPLAQLLCNPDKCTNKFNDINQTILQKSIATCTLSNSNLQKTIDDIGNELTQTSTSENTGIDLAKIISSFGLTVWLPFIIIGVIGLFLVYIVYSMSSGSLTPSKSQLAPQSQLLSQYLPQSQPLSQYLPQSPPLSQYLPQYLHQS